MQLKQKLGGLLSSGPTFILTQRQTEKNAPVNATVTFSDPTAFVAEHTHMCFPF